MRKRDKSTKYELHSNRLFQPFLWRILTTNCMKVSNSNWQEKKNNLW